MSNQLRAAIIALAQSAFPVIVLLGVDLSDDAIAAIMLVITNAITLIALVFPGPEEVVEVPAAAPRELLREAEEQEGLWPGLRDAEGHRMLAVDPEWVERNDEA